MPDNRDDYEPIIATRRSPRPQPEDSQSLWPLALALGAGLVIAALLAWWFMGRPSNKEASTAVQSESPAAQMGPEIRVEQPELPPARDSEAVTDAAPAAAPAPSVVEPAEEPGPTPAPQDVPDVPEPQVQASPVPPAPVPVRFVSPDPQVRFELRGPLDSSPAVTSKVGDFVAVTPGTYQVVASGDQLEPFKQEVTIGGEHALEYTVELCAEPKHESENFAGRVVEEQECASTEQCESTFLLLSEQADEFVKDLAFRKQQCANWRADALPDGRWTLNTQCDGATPQTTCRIEIAEGVCTFAEPPRSVRGTACPRAELK